MGCASGYIAFFCAIIIQSKGFDPRKTIIKEHGSSIVPQRNERSTLGATAREHGSSIVPQRNERSTLGATARGVEALMSILKDAKQTRTYVSNVSRYVKYGNLESAKEDLSSLKHGTGIKEIQYKRGKSEGSILIRHVGDSQFTLFTAGNRYSKHNPFMEVRATGFRLYRIVYQDKPL